MGGWRLGEFKVSWRAVGLQRGRVCDKGALGVLVGRIRKQLSVVAIRKQADCLITRMGNVGEWAGAAGKRRQKVIRWERRWDKEMQAEMVCERQGRMIFRGQKVGLCHINCSIYTVN